MRVVAAFGVGLAIALAVGLLLGVRIDAAPTRRPPRWVADEQRWLIQAGVRVGLVQFWMASLTGAFVAWVVIAAVCGSLAVAFVPAVATAFGPRLYFGRRRAQRVREVQIAWPDGIRDLIASIASGRSLPQAVEALAAHGPEPLQQALAHFPAHVRMVGTAAALELVKEDLADATSDRVIEVLLLAHERGGAIVARILEDLVAAIADDVRLADEIETAGLEMKINSRAVMVMPWAVLVMLTAVDASFRSFYSSTGGLFVIAIGLMLSAIGAVVLGRLQRSLAEPRVLVRSSPRRDRAPASGARS